MITFVTHYQKLSEKEKERIGKVVIRGAAPISEEMIDCMFFSVKKYHPDCRCVLLTDYETPIQDSSQFELIRYPIHTNRIEIAGILAQMQFLRSFDDLGSNIIILDADMLIQGNLNHLFQSPVDIYFTLILDQANIPYMPINIGFVGIAANAVKKAEKLWSSLLKVFYGVGKTEFWGGGQHALNCILIDHLKKFMKKKIPIYLDDILISYLSSQYNYPPKDNEFSEYIDKLIVHFKGQRKKYFLPYFQKYFKGEVCD